MSHPSQTPPGSRPPSARVFRPFTGGGGGGTTGQGTPTSSTPPAGALRRPGQPFRPFVGAHGAQGAAIAPAEPQQQPTPVIVAATAREPVVETIPAPAPTYHEPEPAPIAHEAWERYVAPEPEPELESLVAGEPIAAEPAPAVSNSEITVEVPQIEDAEFDVQPEPVIASEPMQATSMPPITVEVPAIPSEEAMAAIRDVAHEGDLWEPAYSTAQAIEPSLDVVIDEVEAAFSESAPTSPSDTRTDDALVAATALEAIARRLRNGEVEISPAPGANMSTEESALATVLAALLAKR